MPRELWNEGRVVGYSAYEMYVRHHLSVDPEHKPASEKEWLASMMAMGSSMLLKIIRLNNEPEELHYRQIFLPKDSRLCAASTIIASMFLGKGTVATAASANDGLIWCERIEDYGPLINNDSYSHPDNATYGGECSSSTVMNIPPDSLNSDVYDKYHDSICNYIKITDSIIIQPGTWKTWESGKFVPEMEPSLSESPLLRLAIKGKIDSEFYILLTGFTNRSVADGVTGFDSALGTSSPLDGDFLGPWQFPWANKIIFTVSSMLASQFRANIGVESGSGNLPLTCFTEVDDKRIDSLAMSDKQGKLYDLNGKSGSVDIKFKHKSTYNYISTYEGSFTWQNLIDMLHFNKKCNIKLEVKSVDPNNFTVIDITPVLLNSCTDGISAHFKFDDKFKNARLKIPNGIDTWNNLPSEYDGYFRMIIKLNTTEVGTTSKFTILLCALLKTAITFTSVNLNPRWDSGFYWRGNFGDDIRPIFGTKPPGYQSNPGVPVTKTGICEGINGKLHKTFKADSTGHNWGLDLTFSSSTADGTNNDPVVLIDRSYNYGGSNEDPGNLSLIAGTNVNTQSFTYNSANGTALYPTADDRSLSIDEYNELIDNSAVIRDCNGVYSI